MKKSLSWLIVVLLSMALITSFTIVSCKTTEKTATIEEEAKETAIVEEEVEEAKEDIGEASKATGDEWFLEKTAPYKGQTITVVTTSGYGFTEALQLNGETFTELTGVNIEVFELGWTELHEKIMANHVAGSGEYDVVNIDGWPAPSIWNAGALVNMQPIIDQGDLVSPGYDIEDFVANDFLFNGTWPIGGDIHCIPYFPDVLMMFYNKTYLDEYDLAPPQTWEEYENIAEVLNGKDLNEDGKPDYGVGIFGKKGGDIPAAWHNRFVGFGGKYLDENNVPELNSQAALDGMIQLRKHLEIAAPGSYDWDVPMVSRAFVNGDIAICEMWANMPTLADDPNESKIVGEWGAFAGPAGTKGRGPLYGGWSLGIPTYSENQELAFLFIQWATSKEQMRKVVLERGLAMSRISILTDPEILEIYPWYAQLLEGLEAGEGFIKIAEAMEIYELLMEYVSEATQPSNDDPKATLDAMQDEVYDVLEGRGYYE